MVKIDNTFFKMVRQLEGSTKPFRQLTRQLEQAASLTRQLEQTIRPFIAIARRLQYLRELRQREFEHCKYSSNTGCKLIKQIAGVFYYKYNQRPYNMKTLEDFRQEAFLAMLENGDNYRAGEIPEEFIFRSIRSHYKAIYQAANSKARAIDNNKYKGKVEYINPGLCSINAVVFKEWDIQPELNYYLYNKINKPIPDKARGPLMYLSSCDKDYLKGELLEEMLQAVDQLPDLQRDIIKMYYLQGKKIKDICKLLHISTAREQRTRRAALAKLKDIIFY